jgi:hypothetical protein
MEVRIRRASETKSRHLTQTSLDKLDQVIPALEHWGLSDPDEQLQMCGQVVIGTELGDDARAYFEVIVNDFQDPQV